MSAQSAIGRYGSGREVRRIEDAGLLAGAGRFTDDVSAEAQTALCFLRSPHAHARIVSIDATKALAMPGVVAVLTGADLVAAGVKPLPVAPIFSGRTARPGRRRSVRRSRTRSSASSARPSWRSSPRRATRR